MRLNKQDDGKRQCISVTNNEVAAEEQKALREKGLRPGDAQWEQWGICDYITKPRVQAAITGKTPDGKPINGDYKFTDEFPMADGFAENAEFFTLTYETPIAVNYQTAFARIAPLLWLRAGSVGRRIEKVPAAGWDVADSYGLLVELDKIETLREIINHRFQRKHLEISRDSGYQVFSDRDSRPIPIHALSSGEQHQLVLFHSLLFGMREKSLVMIDEPEISLHIAWQEEFIRDLEKTVRGKGVHFLIATHSPQIISDRWDLTIDLTAQGDAKS